MAKIRASKSGGGGLDNSYKILQITMDDSVSTSITVPSNTDFIIVDTLSVTVANRVLDLSSNNAKLGVLKKVGDSFNSAGTWTGASGYTSNAQTLTWTNATNITQTRENNKGYITYYFCQYS